MTPATLTSRLSPQKRISLSRHIPFALLLLVLAVAARATENGASVYPIGVETVFPGMTPPPGRTMLFEFATFHSTNQFADSHGNSVVPEFKLRAFANAFRLQHSWNAHLWGGTLESNLAVPLIYQQLHLPPGKFTQFGVGNIALGMLGVGYHGKNLHWLYEVDGFLPGLGYSKNKVLNIGQHNFALGPVVAFTYLPDRARHEISSRLQYIVNLQNPDTQYRSGNEFTLEYAFMRSLSKRFAVGLNGFYYLQTTDDLSNGAPVDGDGSRGRDFAIGPQIRMQLGALALKYQRDTLVQNKPRGNTFWFQLGLPLAWGHEQ